MRWLVYYDFPYEKELGNGFDSFEAATKAVANAEIPKWRVEIRSELFGRVKSRSGSFGGGRHRAVWNGSEWVNPRYGTAFWG